jgi:hypothetical protein
MTENTAAGTPATVTEIAPKRASAATRKAALNAKPAAKTTKPAVKKPAAAKTTKPAVKKVAAPKSTKYADQRVVASELIAAAGKLIETWSPAKAKKSGISQDAAREMVSRWLSYLPAGTDWSPALGTRGDAGRRAKSA